MDDQEIIEISCPCCRAKIGVEKYMEGYQIKNLDEWNKKSEIGPKKYLGPNIINGKLFFVLLDGSTISCECISGHYAALIMQAWMFAIQSASEQAINAPKNKADSN